MFRCLSLALLLFSFSAHALPRQILIIRHAEKPIVGDEGIHLSDRGIERANALPGFFIHNPEMNSNGMAAAVFAASPRVSTGSVRAYETIVPTASALGLEVNLTFKTGEEDLISKQILTNPSFDGKTIIICWVRDELPLLGQLLGTQNPLEWPSPVFDRAWKITFDSLGHATLTTVQQQLLSGDQPALSLNP